MTLPRIHRAVVRSREVLSPGMIRIALGGDDMGDYPTTGSGDEYVRLFFPDTVSEEPRLPRVVGRGWEYDEGVEPSAMRTYTIRTHRRGHVEIDFVRHDGGLAADWAERAHTGAVIGISEPFAQFAADPAVRQLTLVADATALPAVERIVEQTDPSVRIRVFCEITDPQDARVPARTAGTPVEMTWVHRSGNGLFPSRVAEVFLRTPVCTDGSEAVWVAGESAMTRRIRTHLRKTLQLPTARTHIVGYWTDDEQAWRARFDALDAVVTARLDALYADYSGAGSDAERENVLDDIYALYESVGL